MSSRAQLAVFLLAFAVGCAVFGFRFASLRGLRDQHARAQISNGTDAAGPATDSGGFDFSGRQAPASGGLAGSPSDRVDRVDARVLDIARSLEQNPEPGQGSVFDLIPELADALAGLDAVELEAVVGRYRTLREGEPVPAGAPAAAVVDEVADGMLREMVRQVASILLAEKDPLRALQHPGVVGDGEMLEQAFAAYARRDLRGALAWLDGRPDDGVARKSEIVQTLLVQSLRQGPQVFQDVLGLLDIADRRDDLEAALVASTDVAVEGGAWWDDAMASPDPALKYDLWLARISGIVAGGNLSSLAAVLAEGKRLELGGEGGAIGHAVRVARDRAPAEMAVWLTEHLPEGAEIPALVKAWAKQDYNAAGDWLGGLAPSYTRDKAVAEFAMQVVKVDGEAAMAWVSSISDPNLREPTATAVLNTWQNRDPEGAKRAAAAE